MKLDWSKILILMMLGFIVMIVAMGIKMANTSSDLYEEDYYEKGEHFSERQELEANAKFVSLIVNQNSVKIDFDSIGTVTQINCRKLADKKKDFILESDQTLPKPSVTIALDQLNPGIWVIEVTGTVNNQDYFKKQKFTK